MALGLICFHSNYIPCVLFASVWQAKEVQVGGDLKGDGMQNGGTLVVEKGEISLSSVSISLLSLAVLSSASSSRIVCFRLVCFSPCPSPPPPHPTPPPPPPHTETKQFRRNEFCWSCSETKESEKVLCINLLLYIYQLTPNCSRTVKVFKFCGLVFVIFFRGGAWERDGRGMGGKHQGTNQCYLSPRPHPILQQINSPLFDWFWGIQYLNQHTRELISSQNT